MPEREVKGWAVVSPRGKFVATGTTKANAWLQAEVAAGYIQWGGMETRGYRIVPARSILEEPTISVEEPVPARPLVACKACFGSGIYGANGDSCRVCGGMGKVEDD